MEIQFYKIPLSERIEEIRKTTFKNDILHKAIVEYSEELAQDNIETWVVENNMIVTESGYIVALFKDESNMVGSQTEYLDTCEKVVEHLISRIQFHKLYNYFDKEVINDALLIRNMIKNKLNNEKAN